MAKAKPIYLETTEVPAKKTALEIMGLLGDHGARAITVTHDKNGSIAGMSFVLEVGGAPYPFRLPIRTDQVFIRLQQRRSTTWARTDNKEKDEAAAERIAWRQAFRWLQTQFAMVELGMVKSEEVLLPYLQQGDGQTLFEVLSAGGFKMLGPAKEV